MLFFSSKICFTDIFYFSCSIDSLQKSFHGVRSDTVAGGERGGGRRNSFGQAFGDSLRSLSIKETSEFVCLSAFPVVTMARSSSSNGHARHHEASSTSLSSSSTALSSRRFLSRWTSSRTRCAAASCRSMSATVALGGLDALEQRLVPFTPQQLVHLLLNH
jgi:hypothetical protein